MNNKVVSNFILLLPLLAISPITLASNSLDVEFNGELVSTECQVAPDSLKQKITLYNLRWQFINENEKSAITPFSIAINKCSETDLQKSIKLTWQSNQLVNIGDENYIATKGDSGILLGLVDKDDKIIELNKPISLGVVSVVNNMQQFDFGVFVRKPATADVKVGDFVGTVTFAVEYE
uniref:Type 1 fimbrial protein n=1 Tax=Providencia stuartii TaxID=588 RepID=A0AAI9DB25_PROST|nr:type 1 fimbrial protein [Providencia stuartii]